MELFFPDSFRLLVLDFQVALRKETPLRCMLLDFFGVSKFNFPGYLGNVEGSINHGA